MSNKMTKQEALRHLAKMLEAEADGKKLEVTDITADNAFATCLATAIVALQNGMLVIKIKDEKKECSNELD